MPVRPEAEQKLRAGFQQRVDQQRDRYAGQLAHAEQLADQYEFGEVVGVFTAEVGGGVRTRAYVVGLLPLVAIPLLIAGAAAGIPGIVPLLMLSPFAIGAWFLVSLLRGREPKRHIWFYAFDTGFMLFDDPRAEAAGVRWSQVTQISDVWTDVYDVSSEQTRPALTAYQVRCADGQVHDITRAFQNVLDPYRQVGQMLRGLLPDAVGSAIPRFRTIEEIIAMHR